VCCDSELPAKQRKSILDSIVAQKICKLVANDLVDDNAFQRNTFQTRHDFIAIKQLIQLTKEVLCLLKKQATEKLVTFTTRLGCVGEPVSHI
jgi:hypothetical protein